MVKSPSSEVILSTSLSSPWIYYYLGLTDFFALPRLPGVFPKDRVANANLGEDSVPSWGGPDYYMNMSLWGAPAALAGEDIGGPCRPGGLVDRIIKAGAERALAIASSD